MVKAGWSPEQLSCLIIGRTPTTPLQNIPGVQICPVFVNVMCFFRVVVLVLVVVVVVSVAVLIYSGVSGDVSSGVSEVEW